jgi:hypothetical protein
MQLSYYENRVENLYKRVDEDQIKFIRKEGKGGK